MHISHDERPKCIENGGALAKIVRRTRAIVLYRTMCFGPGLNRAPRLSLIQPDRDDPQSDSVGPRSGQGRIVPTSPGRWKAECSQDRELLCRGEARGSSRGEGHHSFGRLLPEEILRQVCVSLKASVVTLFSVSACVLTCTVSAERFS